MVSPRTQDSGSVGITQRKGVAVQVDLRCLWPVLLSSIAIDSLPSDVSGQEVFTVPWDLTLSAHNHEVLMRST